MKPLSEQDHYETLEIPTTASRADVDRAYHLALATYADDSLAGHSVFEEGDVEVLRERIEAAYRTLADPESRQAYDATLEEQRAALPAPEPAPAAPAAPSAPAPSAAPERRELPVVSLELGFDDLEPDDAGEFDGARLRRSRLRQGVELEDIAKITKVNPTYLRFIEEERFDDLPAAVYVRGFVMGYASCLGLEPSQVARSYMQRYEEKRSEPRRRRFSRR